MLYRSTLITINEAVEACAVSFVKQAISVPTCHRAINRQRQTDAGDPPSLKIISFGALAYSHVWDGSIADSCTRTYRDEYLTPRTYVIEYHKDSEGLWAPQLRLVARGSSSDIQDTYSDISILQHYWLG